MRVFLNSLSWTIHPPETFTITGLIFWVLLIFQLFCHWTEFKRQPLAGIVDLSNNAALLSPNVRFICQAGWGSVPSIQDSWWTPIQYVTLNFGDQRGAASLCHSVTEIAPKSLFLCVNRSLCGVIFMPAQKLCGFVWINPNWVLL